MNFYDNGVRNFERNVARQAKEFVYLHGSKYFLSLQNLSDDFQNIFSPASPASDPVRYALEGFVPISAIMKSVKNGWRAYMRDKRIGESVLFANVLLRG